MTTGVIVDVGLVHDTTALLCYSLCFFESVVLTEPVLISVESIDAEYSVPTFSRSEPIHFGSRISKQTSAFFTSLYMYLAHPADAVTKVP